MPRKSVSGNSITVACDVCRHIYHVSPDRLKTEQTCRECASQFKLVEFDQEAERKAQRAADQPSTWAHIFEWTKVGATSVLVIMVLGMLLSLLWIDPRTGSMASSSRPSRSSRPQNSYSPQRPAYSPPKASLPSTNITPPARTDAFQSSSQPQPFPSTPTTPAFDAQKHHREAMQRAQEALQRMQEQNANINRPQAPRPFPEHDYGDPEYPDTNRSFPNAQSPIPNGNRPSFSGRPSGFRPPGQPPSIPRGPGFTPLRPPGMNP